MISFGKTPQNMVSLWWGVLAFLMLSLLGLVNLTHADYYSGKNFHEIQLIWTMLGFGVAITVMLMDLSIFERLTPILYWIGILLLIMTLFSEPINQSRRWLSIFGLTIQPSEIMKILVVLQLAHHFKKERSQERRRKLRQLAAPLAYIILPAGLVLVEPDLGTALVIGFVGMVVILFEGVRLRSFLILIGSIMFIFPLAWKSNIIRPYQKARIEMWLAPSAVDWKTKNRTLLQKALQPERARWSIGSGKTFGKGARNGSRIRLKYLPEMHTDFIVATLAEEYGFFGCLFMLLLFYAFFAWGIQIAQRATDRFGVLISVGIVSTMAIQVFVNLGMVTGILPVVGVTLPLFSYGGSSLVSFMVGFGLLLNIARTRGQI